jgi:hypothetical protein
MIEFAQSYLSYVFMVFLAFWAFLASKHLKDKFNILMNLQEEEDPSLKYMVGGYCFYHAGIIILNLFAIGVLFVAPHLIFDKPYLIVTLVLAAATVPVADYMFTKAAGDFTEASRLLDLFRLVSYSLEQRKVKARAEAARAQVDRKYLVKANISARVVRPSIRYLNKLYGAERTAEIVQELGVPMAYLAYHDSLLNVTFALDLLLKIKELTGDPKAAFYAQSCGGNLECMGSMFFLLSRWWTVKQCYKIFV